MVRTRNDVGCAPKTPLCSPLIIKGEGWDHSHHFPSWQSWFKTCKNPCHLVLDWDGYVLTYVSQRICRNAMKLKWLRPIPEVWIPLYLLLFVVEPRAR